MDMMVRWPATKGIFLYQETEGPRKIYIIRYASTMDHFIVRLVNEQFKIHPRRRLYKFSEKMCLFTLQATMLSNKTFTNDERALNLHVTCLP